MCEKKSDDEVADEPPEAGEEDEDFDQSKQPSLARIMQMTGTRPRKKKSRGKK